MKGIIKVVTDLAYLECLSLDLAFATGLGIATAQHTESIFYKKLQLEITLIHND